MSSQSDNNSIYDEISIDSLPMSTDSCSARSAADSASDVLPDNHVDEIDMSSPSAPLILDEISIDSLPMSTGTCSASTSDDSVSDYIPAAHVDEMAISVPSDINSFPLFSDDISLECERRTVDTANDDLPDTHVDQIADLNAVIGAAGIHVFSCLPTGDLINGYRSPSLVSSMFHEKAHKALGRREVLSFSGSSHLRKINDGALIRLVRTIIEVSEADHPGHSRPVTQRQDHDCMDCSSCPCPVNALQFLDLRRCRNISGKAVHFLLKHTPNIRRISLASSVSFDAAQEFCLPRDRDGAPLSNLSVLQVPKLEAIDISGCFKVDALGVGALTAYTTGYQSRHLNLTDVSDLRDSALLSEFIRNLEYVGVNTLTTNITGHQIRHLDLSNCSTTLDDNIAPPIAECCRHLEFLGLAGLNKLTSFGVGLMAYCCRDTLRDLTLRGCAGVHLGEIVLPTILDIFAIMRQMFDVEIDRERLISLLPPSFVRDTPDSTRCLANYALALHLAVAQLLKVENLEDLCSKASAYDDLFKAFDERLNGSNNKSETRLFGSLDRLDVSDIGSCLEGCLAAIAWSSGGRLRQVNVSGVSTITDADLLTVAMTSGPRLKVLEACSSVSSICLPDNKLVAFTESCFAAINLSELDVSCCKSFVGAGPFLFPSDIVSLRLDHLPLGSTANGFFIFNLKKLLKLSIVGCTEIGTSDIHLYARLFSPLLLELDARQIVVNTPWDKVQEEIPSLLRLNKKRTALGTKMIEEHVRIERWRSGGRDPRKTGKRKYGDTPTEPLPASNLAASSNVQEGDADTTSTCNIQSCCSILRTGFSTDTQTEQEMFACRTCKIDAKRFVCFACASKCHGGHDVVPVGYGCGYCDCSILAKCDCLRRDGEEEKKQVTRNRALTV